MTCIEYKILYFEIWKLKKYIFSSGTFAVVCLMTGKVVSAYSTPLENIENMKSNLTQEDLHFPTVNTEIYTPIQVATTVTFMVGLIQVHIKKF